MELDIDHIAYHRNGVSGEPFHAVIFRDPDEGRMVGVVFDAPHHVAVFQLDKLALGTVAFGVNSWRGERYEPCLRRLIATADRTDDPTASQPESPNSLHTPGPWHYAVGTNCDAVYVVGDGCTQIAEVERWNGGTLDGVPEPDVEAEAEANARLIAAAPELLGVLADCVRLLADFDESDGDEGEVYRRAAEFLLRVG